MIGNWVNGTQVHSLLTSICEWITASKWNLNLNYIGLDLGVDTKCISSYQSVQSLSHVRLFATTWTAAHQASLSIIYSQSLLKLMPVESVMPSNHLSLCQPFSTHLQSFPASGSFPMSQFLALGGQNIGVSASTSVLPMNIQDWFPLGWTGWISFQSKGLSRVFSNTMVQKHMGKHLFISIDNSQAIVQSLSHVWLSQSLCNTVVCSMAGIPVLH